MDNTWYIKLHRAITENALYRKPNYLAVWMDILLGVNHKPKERIFKWQKIIVWEWEWIFFQKEIADKFWLSIGSVSYILKYLKVENQIEIQTTNSFSIIKVKKWKEYQSSENDFENEVKAKWKRRETPKEWKNERNIISNDIISSESRDEKNNNSIVLVQEEYWNKEINAMLDLLKKAVWLSDFKDSQAWQRRYTQNIIALIKKIGKEEFLSRLKTILADEFKAKNCNKLSYLYWELKSFIHSPVVEKEPQWVRITRI